MTLGLSSKMWGEFLNSSNGGFGIPISVWGQRHGPTSGPVLQLDVGVILAGLQRQALSKLGSAPGWLEIRSPAGRFKSGLGKRWIKV